MLNFIKFFKNNKQASQSANEDNIEINQSNQTKQDSKAQLHELSLINEGRVTINFSSASFSDEGLLIGFFVSNGLSQKVLFKNVPLVLLDSEKRLLARQSFEGEAIGEVAGSSEKACVVRFLPDNVYVQDIPVGCQVYFDKSCQFQFQALPENIVENQRRELEQILAALPPMMPGKVSVSPLKAHITTQNNLLTTVIIRNSTTNKINFDRMSLVVLDANKKEIAGGLFENMNLILESFKAIIRTFNFGPVSQDKEIDLSDWHINVAQ